MKYIELNTYLKIKGIASSGGNAKRIIRNGEILVNDTIETRNKKKIVGGDKITHKNKEYLVLDEEIIERPEKKQK